MVANDSSATSGRAAYTVDPTPLDNPIDDLPSHNPLNLPPSPTPDTLPHTSGSTTPSTTPPRPFQTPIAVVGLACRLPGHSTTPKALWDFISAGGIAKNTPPDSRFRLEGHYDGSKKPHTMRSPGAMFLEDVDPTDLDAGFFGITTVDAIAMDPQQRQLLEVVYECLENAGEY